MSNDSVLYDCAKICDRVSIGKFEPSDVVTEALAALRMRPDLDPHFSDLLKRAIGAAFRSGAAQCAYHIREHARRLGDAED